MGCGGSKKSQPSEHKQLNQQLVTSISNNHTDDDTGETSDDHHTDIMLRKVKEKHEKSPNIPKTLDLEQKIRAFPSICEEDVNEAVSLVRKHPGLHDGFNHLANIMQEVIRKDPGQFMQQLLGTEKSSELTGFFGLIGGASVTVEMYADQLKSLGVTHMTDELLSSSDLNETQEKAQRIIHLVRFFWVDATDASLDFGGHLAEAKLFPYLAKDIKNLDKSFDPQSNVFDESVTILHNCARNRQIRQYFRDICAVQLLTPILARKEKEVKLLTLLTLSHIIDEEENHLLLADDSDFDFLLDSVSLAWSNDDHRAHSGYSLEELLQGLGNLAQNDENKKLLMKKGALIHLKPILEDGSDAEKQESANIVWELAFDKGNKQQMKEDAELMDLLHKMKNSSHRGVAKSCGGALWILNMDIKLSQEKSGGAVGDRFGSIGDAPVIGDLRDLEGVPPPPPLKGGGLPPPAPPSAPSPAALPRASSLTPTQPSAQGHIMISYQWGNQKMLVQIRNSLHARGYKVWMDIDNISGSTLQAMAEAVEDSSVVLLCMSQRYKDSPNCRTEAEYAFALQKTIIPLLMERNYKPDGWLGILRGSKLFFDFSGKYPYEKKLEELVKELGQRGRKDVSEVDGPIVAEKVAPVASAPPQGVDSWSQKNVHNWLHKNHLEGCPKLQSLSGENVKFLQKLSQRAPEFFFTYLKQDLGLTSLNDLMHFSDAIDKLP